MKKAIAQLTALSRNAVRNVRSGKKKVNSQEMPVAKTACTLGAESVSGSIIEEMANPREDTIHTKSAIGLLAELRKSDAKGAKSGRLKVTSIKNPGAKTD